MTKFVLAYRNPDGGEMPTTEEAMAEVMQGWGAWFESLGAALVDGGNPFAQHHLIGSDGAVEANAQNEPLTGYSIIQAADIDSAVTLAKGCPVLEGGGTVEVCEAIDM